MPPVETAWCYQKALLWKSTGFDRYGEPIIESEPTEIETRWEYVNREATDVRGNTVRVDAVVVVDREVPVGSVLWLGSLTDIPGTASYPSTDLRQVVRFTDISDLKGRNLRRVVYLMRLSDEFPGSAI